MVEIIAHHSKGGVEEVRAWMAEYGGRARSAAAIWLRRFWATVRGGG